VTYRRFPRLAWIVTLGAVGFVCGSILLGNMGLAGRNGGVSISGAGLLAAMFGYIGFRFGEWRLKRHRLLPTSH
jgi:hypothetical protein